LKKIDRELEAIEGNFLHCAAYDTLNDPMEGLFRSTQGLRMSDLPIVIAAKSDELRGIRCTARNLYANAHN
jgi:hypothetical protein